MKKITLILLFFSCLFVGEAFSQQVNIFIDAAPPNGGPQFNAGGRASFFMDISPKWQIGLMSRVHRYRYYDGISPNVPEGSEESTVFHEMSVGGGLKYFFYNDVNSTEAFYFNPVMELSSIRNDKGFDFSGNVGYTRMLSPLLNLSVEAGLRHRTVLYSSYWGQANRLQVYLSAGISFRIPYFGDTLPSVPRKQRDADESKY